MAVKKLPEFAKNGQKNTDGLTLEDGFPVNLKPARQWFNFLFNTLALAINQIIDEKLDKTSNAVSATKLQNKRKIYGQDFDGTSDLSANISFDKVTSTLLTPIQILGGGGGSARGINIGDLLVSNSYADYTKVPANGAYVKGQLIVDGGISGNSSSASKLATARMISATANGMSASASFDGSGNINLLPTFTTQPTTTNNATVATTAFVQAVNLADTGSSATALKLNTARTIGGVSFDGSANINLPGVNTEGNQNTSGNAATATKLATSRKINNVDFDGTKDITIVDSTKLLTTGGTITGNLIVLGNISFDKVVSTSADPVSFLTGGVARGIRVGSLLVSNSYSDDAKVPANGAYIKGQLTVDGGISGNSSSASKLATARTITATANGMSASASFDGSGNINLSPTFTTQLVATSNTTVATTAFVQAVNLADTGSSATALKLKTPRKINNVDFDGSKDISIPASMYYWGALDTSGINKTDNDGFYLVSGVNILDLYSYGVLEVRISGNTIHQTYYAHNKNIVGSIAVRQSWGGTAAFTPWRVIDPTVAEIAPTPFGGEVIPSGYLSMQGQAISQSSYPLLYSVYGAYLPDMRGEFIRGWDNGRGVDAGRTLRSFQGDAIRNIVGDVGGGSGDHSSGVFGYSRLSPNGQTGDNAKQTIYNFNASRVVPTAADNRPRNIAFHYIVRGI